MLLHRLSTKFAALARPFCSNTRNDIATTIAELNKEMEVVFGEPPSKGFGASAANGVGTQETQSMSQGSEEIAGGLTHVGNTGEAQMVDVSPKVTTNRTATASCKVMLGKRVFNLVSASQMAKGDVLSVAKIAGISGAKHTSSLIPLCHNIPLTHVRIDLKLNPDDFSVEIEGETACSEKTGVEMEAMTAVTIAGLTVYDMCKAASKDIQISNVRLERKTGGKSGDWFRGK